MILMNIFLRIVFIFISRHHSLGRISSILPCLYIYTYFHHVPYVEFCRCRMIFLITSAASELRFQPANKFVKELPIFDDDDAYIRNISSWRWWWWWINKCSYRFNDLIKSFSSMCIDVSLNRFPCIQTHHLEHLFMALRISWAHTAPNMLNILPNKIRIYICCPVKYGQHQPHAKHKFEVWPDWKPTYADIYKIDQYMYIYDAAS